MRHESAESALLQLAQWARQAFTHASDTDQIAARRISEKMAIVRRAFHEEQVPLNKGCATETSAKATAK